MRDWWGMCGSGWGTGADAEANRMDRMGLVWGCDTIVLRLLFVMLRR